MRIRNLDLRNEPVNTVYGELLLDGDGFVIDLDKYDFKPEALLKVPGFVDGDIYPPEGGPARKRVEVGEAGAPTPGEPEKPKEAHNPTDEEMCDLIKELKQDPKNVNTEGYVDIKVLSRALVERNWRIFSGGSRKMIEDTFGLRTEKKEEPQK